MWVSLIKKKHNTKQKADKNQIFFRPMIKTDLEKKIRYSEIRTHLFSL